MSRLHTAVAALCLAPALALAQNSIRKRWRARLQRQRQFPPQSSRQGNPLVRQRLTSRLRPGQSRVRAATSRSDQESRRRKSAPNRNTGRPILC